MNRLPGQVPIDSETDAFEAVASAYSSLLLLRGMAALLFAFLVFFWPRLTIAGLAMLWGGYSLVDGVLTLTAAFRGRSRAPRLWFGLIGSAGLLCAVGTLVALDEVSAHLVGIIAIWAIATGAMQVWAALEVRKAVDGDWILVADGLGALLFGLALAFWPDLRAEALLWLIGWFAAAVGGLLVGVGYWLGRTGP
ncbi:MAG: HdeD family acid-resistance protein [Reyranella sp.]